jgi:hypothetical protein
MFKFHARVAIVSTFFAAAAFAQVAGRLTGSVNDASGASVANATVNLYVPGGKSPILSTKTTNDGLFEIPTVRPDVYELGVQAAGFAEARIGNIHVDPSQATSVPPITLQVSSTTQTVEVSDSGGATVQTTSAEVSTTLSQSQIESLPVLDRQISVLFITQAGVTGDRTVTAINGLRPGYTNVLLDGINIQDSVRTNSLDFLPNKLTIGQIAEMTVATSNLDSSIGGSANTISLSTPSGTNSFHGNAYWYNRNNYFAANDWFNNKNGIARPFENLNQLGGSIGGPIKHDKLFFFTNYEAYRDRKQTSKDTTILTPTARQGILQYRTAAGVQSFNVLNPFGLGIDPAIQALLSQVPTAGNNNQFGDQLNTTGYTFNARGNETRDNVTGKLDYYLTSRHAFSTSYIWNRDLVDRPDQGTFYTVAPPVSNDNNAHFLSASWRWNPRATLTNEMRGGFDRQVGSFVNSIANPPYYLTGLLFTAPASQATPEVRRTNSYSIQDNANWVRGSHSIAFGFQVALLRTTDAIASGIVPSFGLGLSTKSPYGFKSGDIPGASATDITRANNLLATLAGLVSTGAQTFNATTLTSGFVAGAAQQVNSNLGNYAPYIRDNWKIRHNLTLTLGLRWEYFTPVDVTSPMIEPVVTNGNVPASLRGNAALTFIPNPLYKRDLNNFAPNVGFAYDVRGNGKTVIRGGYSIAYSADNLVNDIPNTTFFGVNNGLSANVNLANQNAIVSKGLPSLTPPAFAIPTSFQKNFDANPNSPPAYGVVDPNLATPYVQQWNISVARDIKGFVMEARYVGNHAVKMLRGVDFNQINVNQNGFVQDFIHARNNGVLSLAAGKGFNPTYNPAIPGSQNLPFFNSVGGGFLTNSQVAGLIQTGEIGSLAQLYQSNFILPDDNFSFFPNPLTLYQNVLTNYSNSTYNGLQAEVRKRTRSGIQFQANYTFSKSLSDALAQRGLDPILDVNNARIEKARTPFDTTHAFKLNHSVPLPFGAGHRFHTNRFGDRIVGGWTYSGFLRIESGPPVSILSARGTLNRGSRSGQNTVDTNLTLDQLKAITGLYKTGNGPYFVDPAHVNPATGQGVAPDLQPAFNGQVFFNPQPGSLGSLQRRILDGPGFWMYDAALIKDIKITERQRLQFRADAYNLFNHPNFFVDDQKVNDPTFGQITSMNSTNYGISTRQLQFGLFYRF